MAGEGSSGFTPPDPHGHCTFVQTDLLWLCCAHTVLLHRRTAGAQPSPGSLTHSAMFNLLQSFIMAKMCLSARKNAKMLIPLPSASDCHHKTGHAGTTCPGGWCLSAEQKIVSQMEVTILSHTRKAEPPWAPGMCPVPTWAARIYHSEWDHPDQEMAQQYRWCNSHTAWGFLQWNLSNNDRRTKADQRTDFV